jgi:hypothetical protein
MSAVEGSKTYGCVCAIIVGLFAAMPSGAAGIPAWLDDAISGWNTGHPEAVIRFVDIKDSFVWYDMPRTPDLGHPQIRQRVNDLVLAHGYAPLDDEEVVTTGKPPVAGAPSTPKKCWSRSFVLNIEAQADTKAIGEDSGQRQRMLTRLVCEDTESWWAAFRIAG